MTIRGRWLAAACAAVLAAGAVVAWLAFQPGDGKSPHTPTSQEIKASAQLYLDESMLEGRKTQLAIVQLGAEPTEKLCEQLWAKVDKDKRSRLSQSAWMVGCYVPPEK